MADLCIERGWFDDGKLTSDTELYIKADNICIDGYTWSAAATEYGWCERRGLTECRHESYASEALDTKNRYADVFEGMHKHRPVDFSIGHGFSSASINSVPFRFYLSDDSIYDAISAIGISAGPSVSAVNFMMSHYPPHPGEPSPLSSYSQTNCFPVSGTVSCSGKSEWVVISADQSVFSGFLPAISDSGIIVYSYEAHILASRSC